MEKEENTGGIRKRYKLKIGKIGSNIINAYKDIEKKFTDPISILFAKLAIS